MYTSQDIADYFLANPGITAQKLIKLVYIAHSQHLKFKGLPLIIETPQAWKYGVMLESLYWHYKKYRDEPIPTVNNNNIGAEDKPFLDKIWEIYGEYTGVELGTMTNRKESPWDITWKNKKSLDISNNIIKHSSKL